MSAQRKGSFSPTRHDALLDAFETLYHELNAESVSHARLADVYDESVHFQDAFHEIEGLQAFTRYCEELYANVGDIEFVFLGRWINGDEAVLRWIMRYTHPRLKRGKPIEVAGMSYLVLGNRVVEHRDYFDGGQLLYEHVPVLGTVIHQLKKRLV